MSILKKGMRGVPVKRLQERLGIDSDGIYGPGTEKAVREYQASAGLAADGIAGPDTFTALGLNELVLLRVGTPPGYLRVDGSGFGQASRPSGAIRVRPPR
jgi:peptidoglycan hydrolase-like protein with peptidoglycan-binding domain